MPAAEANTVAVQRLIDRNRADTGQQRRAGGVLSARRGAPAYGGENRTRSWTRDISGGGPTCQPGRHRRVPWTQFGQWPGWHFAAVGGFLPSPARGTDAAVTPAAGPTPHTRQRG
jgi:hypothetical protein